MYEVAERLDEAADILEKLTGAVIHGNEKLIATIEQGNKEVNSAIDRGNAMLAEKIDAGRAENREGFGKLAEKIEGIKEDTGEMTNRLSFLNLEPVHRETLELKEKYELLSSDVAVIKIKINVG